MSHRPVNPVSPDHPRWSVLDSASAKYLLVDIGLERKADMDGNVCYLVMELIENAETLDAYCGSTI